MAILAVKAGKHRTGNNHRILLFTMGYFSLITNKQTNRQATDDDDDDDYDDDDDHNGDDDDDDDDGDDDDDDDDKTADKDPQLSSRLIYMKYKGYWL